MKKDEFLIAIEANLSEYPEPWVEAIVNRYILIFKEEASKGFTEEAIIKKLGDPYLVAQKCKQEGYIPPLKEVNEQGNSEKHSFKEETENMGLPDFNNIEVSSKNLLQSFFKILTFILFLIVSLPLFAFLLFLITTSISIFIAGIAVSIGGITAPSYINIASTLPRSIITFGALGTISLGISIAIGGILLLKLNLRVIKNLTKKISGTIGNKKDTYKVDNTRLKKPFMFFMGLTSIFYGIFFTILNYYL